MYLSPRKKLFVDTAAEMFGEGAVITKAQKAEAAEKAAAACSTWRRTASAGHLSLSCSHPNVLKEDCRGRCA